MRRVILSASIPALLGVATAVLAHEGHQHGKKPAAIPKPQGSTALTVEKVRLNGEIIDPQCWFVHNGEGASHAGCAVTCARGGQDLAFLDRRTGQVYSILADSHGKNPNAGLYEHVGMPVSIRGTAYRRGSNRALIIQGVTKSK